MKTLYQIEKIHPRDEYYELREQLEGIIGTFIKIEDKSEIMEIKNLKKPYIKGYFTPLEFHQIDTTLYDDHYNTLTFAGVKLKKIN